ncbi:MAG: hypothetical protein FWG65_11750 [Turicibacter sp.]|nr:hypothetical protein [Turicibacter sp.]
MQRADGGLGLFGERLESLIDTSVMNKHKIQNTYKLNRSLHQNQSRGIDLALKAPKRGLLSKAF